MFDRIFFGIIILLIIAIPGFLIYLIVDAANDRYNRPLPAYKDGEYVQMKLSHDRGMIVSSYCYESCEYSIRFSSLQMHTNVSLLGADGPINIAPVALVRGIEEFEIERAN